MIQKLVWENVKHRPLRTLLSGLLIAIPVTLVLTLTGLSKGMMDDVTNRSRGVGADIIMRPQNSSFLSLGSATISQAVVDIIRKQPHVTLATGVLTHPLGNFLNHAGGVEWTEFNQMSGGFDYVEGGPTLNPDEVIVDQYYARQNKLHAGDSIELLNQKRRVAGIVKPGKLNRVYIDRARLQDLTSNTGKVNTVYVKVDDRGNLAAAVAGLKALLPDYQIYSIEEFAALFTYDSIPALAEFTGVVVGIGIFIGFAVVCLSMYMAVLQRTREIGILKALGASRWYIVNIILREAILLGVVGTIVGIGMSYGAKWLLETFAPASFRPAVDPSWWPAAAAIALVGAMLGALYPGLRAARMDPIEALSYE